MNIFEVPTVVNNFSVKNKIFSITTHHSPRVVLELSTLSASPSKLLRRWTFGGTQLPWGKFISTMILQGTLDEIHDAASLVNSSVTKCQACSIYVLRNSTHHVPSWNLQQTNEPLVSADHKVSANFRHLFAMGDEFVAAEVSQATVVRLQKNDMTQQNDRHKSRCWSTFDTFFLGFLRCATSCVRTLATEVSQAAALSDYKRRTIP